MKDILFLLKAPFLDGDQSWYCNDCATMEGALLANPQWNERVDIRRIAFPRPRWEVVDMVGEAHQGLPMLIMEAKGAPMHALKVNDKYAILKDIREIGWALATRHGGVGPHP
jgi:hypothetical protein